MIDLRFFDKAKTSMELKEIAAQTGAHILGDVNGKVPFISDIAPLHTAGVEHISFFENKKYLDTFKASKAGACFMTEKMAAHAPKGMVCLISDSPYMAYALTAQMFYPIGNKGVQSGISENAYVDKTATLGKNVTVEMGAVIKANVEIGDDTYIGANSVIEQGVIIGAACNIASQVTLSHCILGNRVSIATGARIGQPGFGFAISPKGFVSVPQLGRVRIEDDVDIGANTTIDRGTLEDTVIGQGTRIDNLVQLGHNVRTGKMCVIVSQTGISGSTSLGDFVMTGGQVGLAGHLKIASGTKIAAQSGVMQDINEPGEYMGSPVMPLKKFMRQILMLRKMVNTK